LLRLPRTPQGVLVQPTDTNDIMKVPLSWLRDYVNLTLPAPQLVERLTLAGLEVGGIELVGVPAPEGLHVKNETPRPVWDRDKIFVAKVLEVNKHPDADRLTLVTVDYGREPKQVVTGAPNIRVGDRGQKVIVALAGSVLIDGHAEGNVLKALKPTKIRGVPSDAMVCSAKELGLSDEHEGIILLEEEAPVGMPLADFMGDVVLEIDVLPNMARCLSLLGIAREVAALTGQAVQFPRQNVEATSEAIAGRVTIEIENPSLCARYAAAIIREVKHGAAPAWMQRRLSLAGMRPLGNIVDITNYVMLEWGQPLHAFDYDKLAERAQGKSPNIIVRTGRKGEVLTTLDGQKRELQPEHLLIADSAGPIALAGVMGGLETEVTAQTNNILLESANFNFISIRRTARGLDLPSEASLRFSRGVHPEMVKPGVTRAAELMRQHAGGQVLRGLADHYPAPVPEQVVTLPLAEVRRLLGICPPVDEVTRILRSLEFKVESAGSEVLRVTTPPHRLDIQHGTADLVEELARIYGYDRLSPTLPSDRLPRQENNRSLVLEERVRDILVNAGLQEVLSYSLTTPEKEAPLVGPGAEYVRLANPVTAERAVMRRSVLASVVENAASNLRNSDTVHLFELGAAYLPMANSQLPVEPRRLAIIMAGPPEQESWSKPSAQTSVDFFDLKGVLEALVRELHVGEAEYRPTKVGHLHPGKSAEIVIAQKPLGTFGQLHPKLNEPLGLGRREVFVAELDLEGLLATVPERYTFTPIPPFPPVRQDIAVVVDESLPAAKVEAEICAGGGSMLRAVRLFDVYRGPNIPTGSKSLAYALTYQADDRTLTDKEVAKVHSKIVSRLENVLGAHLRA
jgi:phenylalanyl-tRNA synthetase beta chain